jgi:hypothetical protein
METAHFFFIPFEALLCDQSETLQSLPQTLCLDNNEPGKDVFSFLRVCVCGEGYFMILSVPKIRRLEQKSFN